MFCASITYPLQKDGIFNFEYFLNTHIPMFIRFLGDNCMKSEVHKNLSVPGAPASIYICSAYLWIKSSKDFAATLAQYGTEIYADIPKFTNIEPIRQWSEVIE